MSRLQEASKENRIKALIELRDLLAEHIDNCQSNRDLAALSRQFVQVLAEIDELNGSKNENTVSLTDFRGKLKVVGI